MLGNLIRCIYGDRSRQQNHALSQAEREWDHKLLQAKRQWDNALPQAKFAYNNAVHSVTSAFALVYRTVPKHAVNLIPLTKGHLAYVDANMDEKVQNVRYVVKTRLEQTNTKYKTATDKQTWSPMSVTKSPTWVTW